VATLPTSGDAPTTLPRNRDARLRRGQDGISDDPAHSAAVTEKGGTRVRAGVIYGLGALLLAVNAYFGTYAYVVVQALLWTQTSLQRGPVVLLFCLVLLNLWFARFARRWALNQQELLILYGMLTMGTCAAGYGFVQILINHMASPFYFATGGNGFKERILPHVPLWLAPQDPEVYNGFFRGNSTLYTASAIQGWAVPVLSWSAFIVVIFWTLLCATSLVRRQWVEEERLTFPLVLLPLEMTGMSQTIQGSEGGTPFWKNKLMWAGFLIAGILESANFINFLYPSFPALPLKAQAGMNRLDTLFVSRPWNTMGMLTLAFYPFAIGIGYLLSLDVSFSCWFLYLMTKVAIVTCAAMGLTDNGGGQSIAARLPFIREQGVGAFVGIALFSAWMARRALALAWQEMKRPTGADRTELMTSRLAIVGGIAGTVFLVGFLIAAGFSPTMALIFVFVYLCFALTLARIVSEAGAGWAWAPSWSPASFMVDTIGPSHLTPQQLTMGLGYGSWMSDMRDNPMPHQMESMKLAQGASLAPRAFLKPLVFAIVLGVFLAFWAHLDIYYTYGAATAKVRPALSGPSSTGPARNAAALIVTPTLHDTVGLAAAGGGALLAVGFSVLRQMLPWWPLHPLGYALAATNSMEYMWCPFFLAWLAKLITVRYGGIRAYRAALPFFLGLILGDYVVPCLWGLFGMATGYQQYMVFPH
jgi:hypothetical protein